MIVRKGRLLAMRGSEEVRAALALLTRLPLATSSDRAGVGAFGVVGGGLGLLSAVPLLLLGARAPLAAAVLTIGLLAILSGTLHLDGLGDTADALAARDSDAAERARQDPRMGAAGTTAIVAVVVLDAALLAALVDARPLLAAAACVTASAGSRTVAAVIPTVIDGATGTSRLGAWLLTQASPSAVVAAILGALVIAVAAAVVASERAVLLGLVGGSGLALLMALGLIRTRGGVDGDIMGAVVELAFAGILLATMVAA